MNIPLEIEKFLNGNWGKSLVIKGNPGCGKTTLALEIMEYGLKKNGAIYLSMRQGDQSLYNQFPWLRTEEYKNAIIDSSYELLQRLSGVEKEEMVKSNGNDQKIIASKKFIENIGKGYEPSLSLHYLSKLNINNPEYLRFLYLLKTKYKPGLIVLIDSLEGLSQRWGLSKIDFLDAVLKDLVESSGLNIIIISEQSGFETTMDVVDYLVDGVIKLEKHIENHRVLRILTIEKLRFVESKNKTYSYTLTNGRFSYFDPNLIFEAPNLKVRKEGNKIRLGIPEMDNLINDEIRWFSATLNIGLIPSRYVLPFFAPVIAGYLERGMGAILLPDPNVEIDEIYANVAKYLDDESYTKNLRIGDFSSEVAIKKYAIPLGYESAEVRNRELTKTTVSLMDETKGILFFYKVSSLERILGQIKDISDLSPIMSTARPKNDKILLILDYAQHETNISGIGNYNFELSQEGNIRLFYSNFPFTPYYSLQKDDDGHLFFKVIE